MYSAQFSQIVKSMEGKTHRKSFTHAMKGVKAAEVTLKPFAFGKPAIAGTVYRKFFYNSDGNVTKKLSFAPDGKIVMKEEHMFGKNGKIERSQYITDSSRQEESFIYNKNGCLEEYIFSDSSWDVPKREVYEFDKSQRKVKKISYGRLGIPELITHYFYKSTSKKYTYRFVTQPDGALIMTMLYTYDKNFNQVGLRGFLVTPNELTKLIKNDKDWELKSAFRSLWTYDKNNNPTGFRRDENSDKLSLIGDNSFGDSLEKGRIVTIQSSSEYTKIKGKDYLIKTTEWLPKYNEPLKEIKEYQYYDNTGKVIFPIISKS